MASRQEILPWVISSCWVANEHVDVAAVSGLCWDEFAGYVLERWNHGSQLLSDCPHP